MKITIRNISKKLLPFTLIFIVLGLVAGCGSEKKSEVDESAIETKKDLTQNHKNFIVRFYPAAAQANKNILSDRALLITKRRNFGHVMNHPSLLSKLKQIATRYRFDDNFFHSGLNRTDYKQRIDSLLYYVDYIPEKLVMAQAIIESGWGSSRFASEINNYYGIRCYKPGCGRAASDVENPKFWVKAYPNIEACISEYLWTLNTGRTYEGLRETRKTLREANEYPNAMLLAQGLEKYSEKGSEYIALIEAIINDYLPGNLQAFVDHRKD